jgi:hypothetical protein
VSLRDWLCTLTSPFGNNEVASPAKSCPGATPVIHIVDDGGTPTTSSATVKSTVEVSNRVTTADLPPGFLDVSLDRDNFKIEVIDSTITGNVIPANKIDLEALNHKKESFSPPRKLQAELRRVGTTNVFRSRYIRLVVDDADLAATGILPDQKLLTDWDPAHPEVEILAQVVRATYSSANAGKVIWEATVGNGIRMHVRVALHVLLASGSPVVPLADTQLRVQKWMRRNYAQISMAPKITLAETVRGDENLISISDDTGTNATGGGAISFTLRWGARFSRKTFTVGPHTPLAGDTPMVTANHLVTLIRQSSELNARAVQNSYFMTPGTGGAAATAGGSADVVITDRAGTRVWISGLTATDATQTVAVAQVNATNFRGWGGYTYWFGGSIAQRCVLQNHDSGRDRIDIVVVVNLVNNVGVSDALGHALNAGDDYPAGQRPAREVMRSVYIAAQCMNAGDGDCYALGHECGHVLLDATHVPGNSAQIMWDKYLGGSRVDGPKRFNEASEMFDFPVIGIVQETRIRARGAGMLLPFLVPR